MKTFKLGKDKFTGKILEITEVKGGLDCNCVCPNCGEDLIAAQGEKTDWYFRHHEQTTCEKGAEKGLLALAKDILTTHSEITLPEVGKIAYQKATTDKKPLFLSFAPAISAKTQGEKLYFDILVDGKDLSKRAKTYRNKAYKSIEVDLRDYAFSTIKDFRRDLLKDPSLKRVIYWEEPQKTSTPNSNTQEVSQNGDKRIIPTIFTLLGAGIALGAIVLARSLAEDEEQEALKSQNRFRKPQQLLTDSKHVWEDSKKILESGKNKLLESNNLIDKSKGLFDKSKELVGDSADSIKDFSKKLLEKYA